MRSQRWRAKKNGHFRDRFNEDILKIKDTPNGLQHAIFG